MPADDTPTDKTGLAAAGPDRPLKLIALDAKDLAVVSAHVQDAVVKAGEIVWSPARRQLTLPMNRFAWERTLRASRRNPDERRRSVLHFGRVEAVRSTGFAQDDADAVVALLAIVFEPTDPPAGVVTLVCAGEAAIRLDVECIEAQLTDLGAAWQASMRPKHRLGRETET